MSFQAMKESLVNAYDRNVQIIRMTQLINDGHAIIGEGPGKLRIPALSGPAGIGKTTCVKDFVAEKEFELIEVDCSYMPSKSTRDTARRLRYSKPPSRNRDP